jgi:hypothetical protein
VFVSSMAKEKEFYVIESVGIINKDASTTPP